MSQVSVTINGRSYDLTCDDGEEDHLRQLAAYVDGRVTELVTTTGQIGDLRLLVLASLMVADELGDANGAVSESEAMRKAAADRYHLAEATLAAALDDLSQRLEHIAARLEGT